MEWQAAFGSGAILSPKAPVQLFVSGWRQNQNHHGRIVAGSTAAQHLIREVSRRFLISSDSTRIRLEQLGIFSRNDGRRTLVG